MINGTLFKNHLRHVLATLAVWRIPFGLPASLSAQWTTGTGGVVYYNGGSVGIGTTSPTQRLDVDSGTNSDALIRVGSINSNVELGAGNGTYSYLNGRNWDLALQTSGVNRLYIPVATGNLGVGTTSPAQKLEVSSGTNSDALIRVSSINSNVELGAGNGTYSYLNGRSWDLALQTSGVNRLYIPVATGFVGIGTTSPQHLLHVAGTIGAEQVIVSATGADYVFDPNYRLAPLREVAAYVNANHHLPGIPSAEEMKRDGVSVGDLQTKLLAKVEELTLHMVELEKQNLELKERLAHLEIRSASQQP